MTEDPDFIRFLSRNLPPAIAELMFMIVQLAMVREEIDLLSQAASSQGPPYYTRTDADAMDKVRALALRVGIP
jgi:hypothetical protein